MMPPYTIYTYAFLGPMPLLPLQFLRFHMRYCVTDSSKWIALRFQELIELCGVVVSYRQPLPIDCLVGGQLWCWRK